MTAPDDLKIYTNSDAIYYTASLSSHQQGTEIKQIAQLFAFSGVKIRGNISFGTTLDGVLQEQNFFNDTRSPNNAGSTTTGSNINYSAAGRISQQVIHETELRDLGISTLFNNNEPFEEASDMTSPVTILGTHPLALVLPTSLVQICASPSSFDGVIEPLDIRRIVDRSSIEFPYIMHSVKGSLGITNVKRESIIIDDYYDLRNSPTDPYLDSVETMGTVNLPGATSDADNSFHPFVESSDIESFYTSGSLDVAMRDQLINGFVSGTITYTSPRINGISSHIVFMSHGTDFSQNDNYKYDSIAFGGLLK